MTVTLARAVAESERALESARALWRERLVPECHAYMVLALRTLVQAWAAGEATEPAAAESAPSAGEKERALGAIERAGYGRLDRLRAALEAAANATAPATPATPAVHADFETTWAELERLLRFTRRHSMSAAAKKRARILLASALGVVLVLALIVAARLWIRPRVIASAVLGWEFPASYATDGLEATEWLLPDKTPGWLDVVFPSSRSVRQVRLFNVHNRYFADRASERVRVTAFDGFRALASVEGRFDKIRAERSELALDLKAEGVTRVRVEVLSSFGLGGGLAEVEVR